MEIDRCVGISMYVDTMYVNKYIYIHIHLHIDTYMYVYMYVHSYL